MTGERNFGEGDNAAHHLLESWKSAAASAARGSVVKSEAVARVRALGCRSAFPNNPVAPCADVRAKSIESAVQRHRIEDVEPSRGRVQCAGAVALAPSPDAR